MDRDQIECLACCGVVVGIVGTVGLGYLIGTPGILIGMGLLVLLLVGMVYGLIQSKRNKTRALQQIAANAAMGQLRLFQANAKKLVDLFAMSTKVVIEDVRTIMEFDTRKEALDLLLALKQWVPGMMLDGEQVTVPSTQELALALDTYVRGPIAEETAGMPGSWMCEECGHRNSADANFCEGCGYRK